MRVLLTGATGFLGRHTVRALRDQKHDVISATRGGAPAETTERVELDLTVPESIRPALAHSAPDAVIHCAAYGVDHCRQDPDLALAVNVTGTLNLYLTARKLGIDRFIHVGTGFEYGDHPGRITEQASLQPVGLYGASKAAGSLMLAERGRSLGQGPVIVRPFSMYGPGERGHKLAPQVVRAARLRQPLDLTAGSEIRDYLPVSCAALALAGIVGLSNSLFPFGSTFNICSGRAIGVRAFAESVCRAAGGHQDLLRFGAIPSRADAPQSIVGDPGAWRRFCRESGLTHLLSIDSTEDVVKQMLQEELPCAT